MKTIIVYGPGCAKCKQAEQIVQRVVREAGGNATVEKITDYQAMAQAGIMATPAVAVDGVVKVSGRVPNAAEVKHWLKEGA
jgi:small redox-active disulfide protein 2